MARVAGKRASPSDDHLNTAAARRGAPRRRTSTTPPPPPPDATGSLSATPSPAISFSSDKENQRGSAAAPIDKTRVSTGSGRGSTGSSAAGPRRRQGLEDRTMRRRTTRDGEASEAEAADPGADADADNADDHGDGHGDPEADGADATTRHSIFDTRFYDPDQTLGERRPVRKAIRDLTRELQESRHEYMAGHSRGIYDTVLAANAQFTHIKQTSDATLDSNLLVKAADLAARRAVQLRQGGSARGVDAGEFAARCAAFMRRGPSAAHLAALPAGVAAAVARPGGNGGGGSRRPRPLGRSNDDADSDNDLPDATQGDDGDELNWAWLGVRGAHPANIRPATPGFLLGPLSVQKRVRAVTQRAARATARDPAEAVRPAELETTQIERVENANLTAQCRKLYKQLRRYQATAQAAVEAEAAADAAAAVDPDALLDRHRLRPDGGVCLLHFAFNPRSFGQTVENLFYLSFLVRDGKAGLTTDADGRPSLHATDPTGGGAAADGAAAASSTGSAAHPRRQAVLHLDFATWRGVCAALGLEASIVPHRAEDGERELGGNGWYG